MVRVLTGVSLLWFLVPGYALALGLSFLVPKIFTAIAFDSGWRGLRPTDGHVSAALCPIGRRWRRPAGAWGNYLTDAFGIVAMVAMTPLITIQSLGLTSALIRKAERRRLAGQLAQSDYILYYDEPEQEASAHE